MMKTAIYGLARFFLEFLGAGPAWWGWTILVLAVISAVVGALYSSQQTDLKRLVAYSSVENLGIILLGIGSGMVFVSYGHPALAGLAWAAALYHVMNHAIFKSLMFMGTGSVLYATDSRNMDELGGLIKRMPVTAPLFLLGAVAISALPPLNGFVSEWLTFQTLFSLPQAADGTIGRVAAVLLIAGLGLTGAVAATTFVKAFGITFLAKPRSQKAEQAVEVPAAMNVAIGLLGAAALVLGVWPQWLLGTIKSILTGYAGLDFGSLLKTDWYAVAFQAPQSGATLAMPVLVGIIAVGLIAALVLYRLNGRPRVEEGEVWSCGQIPTPVTQYTGKGFTRPIKRAFRSVLKSTVIHTTEQNGSAYHGVKMTLSTRIHYLIDEKFYHPLTERIKALAVKLKPLQSGSLQVYIGYIMVVTVILLIVGTR
jgi:hydrogenase-4 component B